MGATYGSFRIKVNRKDSDKCLREERWPQGWKIRRFFRSYKVKKGDNGIKLKKEIEDLKKVGQEEKLKIQRDKLAKKVMGVKKKNDKIAEMEIEINKT